MRPWLRWIFGAAFIAGIAYLTWRVSAQIEFTRFLLDDPVAREEPHIIPIAWIWSSIPASILWCSLAFYGFTAGTGLRLTRMIALMAGILAITVLIAFILSLMFPIGM